MAVVYRTIGAVAAQVMHRAAGLWGRAAGRSDLIDATQLSVERFAEGRLLEETAVL